MTQQDPTTGTGKTSTANETKEDIRSAGADVAGSMRDAAHDAAGTLSDSASRAAEKAQSSAADEVANMSSALRTAAGELRSGSPQDRAFSHVADSLADASDALRNKDMGEMLSDLNGFARRNPLTFLGGAALVGFAATRLAKASAERPSHAGSGMSGSATSTPGTSTSGMAQNRMPPAGATAPGTTTTPGSTAATGTTTPPPVSPNRDKGL